MGVIGTAVNGKFEGKEGRLRDQTINPNLEKSRDRETLLEDPRGTLQVELK